MAQSKLSGKEIDEILDATRANVAEWTHSMSEQLFVEYFLPAFRDKSLHKDIVRTRLVEFARGAGGMTMPVNVVSPTGEILFQVPPLQSTVHMSQKRAFKSTDVSFTELLARVSNMYDYNYAQGDAMLKSKVLDRVKKMVEPESPQWKKHLDQWMAIFARYPLAPAPGEQPAAQTTQAPAPTAVETVDDTDFEGTF